MSATTELSAAKAARSGLSAKTVVIIAMIIIISMHVLIVVNTLRINRTGQTVSTTMQSNFAYSQTVKEFNSTANSFTDLARAYVSTGAESYIASYLHAMEVQQAQDASVRQMLTEQSPYAYDELLSAMRFSVERIDMECRAMRLAAEAYGVDLAQYSFLAEAELTEEEKALPTAEKQRYAALLLVSSEYLRAKGETNERISRAVQTAGEETARSIARQTAVLERYRALQWVMTIVIIAVLTIMCVLLFVFLLIPLEKCMEIAKRGEPIPTGMGFAELRRLAAFYNEQQGHRKTLDDYQRRQSRTDELTGLPNRLAFQDQVSRLSREKPHAAVAAFSIDVNGLKAANDLNGVSFGDELLRSCAACVQSSFGGTEDRCCFRFGGDEFAAFWVGAAEEEIAPALDTFQKKLRAFNISVSVGHAFAGDLGATTLEALFEQADRNMYAEKEERRRPDDGSGARGE